MLFASLLVILLVPLFDAFIEPSTFLSERGFATSICANSDGFCLGFEIVGCPDSSSLVVGGGGVGAGGDVDLG